MLLGKLIKLDVNSGAATVVAVGLRNPWRFSFDRANGQIVIADVGHGAYGGDQRRPGRQLRLALPRGHASDTRRGRSALRERHRRCPCSTRRTAGDGFCSITGGYVVRDPGPADPARALRVRRFLRARAALGGSCEPGLGRAARPRRCRGLSSFGEDMCGRLFVMSLSGPVYRLVDGAPSACPASRRPPAPPAVAPDRRACSLAMTVSGVRSVRRLKRLSIALRTDEACRATVRASIKGVAQFRRTTASVSRREAEGRAGEAHGARGARGAQRHCAGNRRFPSRCG